MDTNSKTKYTNANVSIIESQEGRLLRFLHWKWKIQHVNYYVWKSVETLMKWKLETKQEKSIQ